jgi:Transposase (partial DDE domain)
MKIYAYPIRPGAGFRIQRLHRKILYNMPRGHKKKISARWVPKLLTATQKSCNVFPSLLQKKSLSLLNNIVTMDESAVSFHTPETKKKQSRQWFKKGTPGPVKAKVHATRSKQMILAFFDNKGIIYTIYVCSQGGHSHCHLHCGGPEQFPSPFQKEEARNG